MTPAATMRLGAALVALGSLFLAAVVASVDSGAQEVASARGEVVVLEGEAAAAAQEVARLRADLADAQERTADLDALLSARGGFLAAVDAAAQSFDAADGKVSVTAARDDLLVLQERVLAERDDRRVIDAAASRAKVIIADVDEAVADYDAAHPTVIVPPGGAAGSESYQRVRRALDHVGGAGIPLHEFAGACAGGTALACSNSNGFISFRPELASWGDARLNWAMAHELAHMHQFRVWGALNGSGAFGKLYGHSYEYLANCMAQARGYPGGVVSCSAVQLTWAAAIWAGRVQ